MDEVDVLALQRVLQALRGSRDAALIRVGELIAVLGEELFGLVDQLLRVVLRVDLFSSALILLGKMLGISHGALDILLAHV